MCQLKAIAILQVETCPISQILKPLEGGALTISVLIPT